MYEYIYIYINQEHTPKTPGIGQLGQPPPLPPPRKVDEKALTGEPDDVLGPRCSHAAAAPRGSMFGKSEIFGEYLKILKMNRTYRFKLIKLVG